jgi:hypothetical protein
MLASFAFDEAGSPVGYILAYETIRRPRQSRPALNAEARESSEGYRFGRRYAFIGHRARSLVRGGLSDSATLGSASADAAFRR